MLHIQYNTCARCSSDENYVSAANRANWTASNLHYFTVYYKYELEKKKKDKKQTQFQIFFVRTFSRPSKNARLTAKFSLCNKLVCLRAVNLWAKNSAIEYLRSSGTRKNCEINTYEISLRRRNGAKKESKSEVPDLFFLFFFSILLLFYVLIRQDPTFT